MATSTFSRRDLLKTGGALVVSFAIGARAPAQTATGADATLGKPLDINEVDSFLVVHADGSVTVYTGKVDLGTGLRIAIRQMAAEELDLPVERVSLVEGDTALTPDQGGTGGSTGLTRGGVEVRQAAATAREASAQDDSRGPRQREALQSEGGPQGSAERSQDIQGGGPTGAASRNSVQGDRAAPLRAGLSPPRGCCTGA